jgi:hypothetical protein
MADFALWGEAISQAMGYEPYEFLRIYFENIGKQNVEAIEAHPLAQAITKFVYEYGNDNPDKSVEYAGQTKELLNKLNEIAIQYAIETDSSLWPKSISVLSRRLKEIKSNLLEGYGIDVIVGRDAKTNTSMVTIRKMSPVHPVAPDIADGTSNMQDFIGDNDGIGDMLPPKTGMPPADPIPIHTANDTTGDIGVSGGNSANALGSGGN